MLQHPKKIINSFRKASRKKKAVVIIIVLILAMIVFNILRPKDPAQGHVIEAAEMSSVTELVSETGNVTTSGITPIYSTTTGMVDEVYVKNGDSVAKDQVLFKVLATATKQEKDSALATYLAAKSSLETAQATQLSLQAAMFGKWDAYKNLAEGETYENADGSPRVPERNVAEFHIYEKEWLASEQAYEKQQVAINQAQAQVSATWLSYQATQDSQVRANFGGQVQNLSVARGDMVISNGPATTTAPVLVVVDKTIQPIIKIEVNETDALKVKSGQEATINFDAITDQAFVGVVDRVDTVSNPSLEVVQFAVYIKVLEPTSSIRSGMTADVDIVVESKDNVLTVKSSAIKPYQDGRAVRILTDKGEIEFIPVIIGARGGGKTEIVSGLEPGVEVIVSSTNDQVSRSGGFF